MYLVQSTSRGSKVMSGPANFSSLQSDSSQFWRKFTDEQTSHNLSLTRNLVENDFVKREIVWERVRID